MATLQAHNGSPPASRPFNIFDALSYHDAVRSRLLDHPNTYNCFLDVMEEFRLQLIDTSGLTRRVAHLFRDHPALIEGFNSFLPQGYRIDFSRPQGSAAYSIIVTTPTARDTTIQNTDASELLRVARDVPGLSDNGDHPMSFEGVRMSATVEKSRSPPEEPPTADDGEFDRTIGFFDKIIGRYAEDQAIFRYTARVPEEPNASAPLGSPMRTSATALQR